MEDNGNIAVMITGATGMVGEGVLLECLAHPRIERVLLVTRRSYGLTHPKLSEMLIPDFLHLGATGGFAGYHACFFCAGVSSLGMSEAAYTRVTYDLTLNFAGALAAVNPAMSFVYVSGASTDGTEQGKIMWARVKGRTENALTCLGFKRVYNFRPGLMRPTPGQRNVPKFYRALGALYPLAQRIWPDRVSTLQEVARAMIRVALNGHPKSVLEVPEINALGANSAD